MLPSIARLTLWLAYTSVWFAQVSLQQTYSACNPLFQTQCPPNPALGKSITVDFTKGSSNEFSAQGNPSYGSSGASFTVAKTGDAPTIISKWYIMFGRVEVRMKAAPGAGIVSSAVLQSDDLDEIDWEWIGAKNDEVQSNFFGKGQTTTYNRGAIHATSNTQGGFHTYTIDWNAQQIVWQIDGRTIRVLKATDAGGQYPQTPMQVKLGAWSGGDPSNNAPGTVQWAEGPTNYANGPFTMVVQSIAVTDYSTGTQYSYGDTSGSWGSIRSSGGAVNGNSKGSLTNEAAPAITSMASGGTEPFQAPTNTKYPGLPSGWIVTDDGKVRPPPSAASGRSSRSPNTYGSGGPPLLPTGAPNIISSAASSIIAEIHVDTRSMIVLFGVLFVTAFLLAA